MASSMTKYHRGSDGVECQGVIEASWSLLGDKPATTEASWENRYERSSEGKAPMAAIRLAFLVDAVNFMVLGVGEYTLIR